MKNLSGWKIIVLVGLVVGMVGFGNLSRFNLGTSKTQSVGLSNESARYLESIFSGQIPPRFDSYENAGFGNASFIFQYPLQIWIGILVSLLGFSGNAARSINFIATIGFFLWGLLKVEMFFKTRNFTLTRAAVIVLAIVALELVHSDLAVTLMFMPWLVWAAARFVKTLLAHSDRLWSRVISQEGLLLVLVISMGLLNSSGMLAVSLGLVLGVLATGTKSAVKPLILCLLWALANTAWFWLPQYAEQAEVISNPYTGNIITKSFDAQKANAIFDDYPNQKVISPNAAVKIMPLSGFWQTNSYRIIVPEKSLLIQKSMHFPGWRVKANDQPVTLENPEDNAGLVAYQLEAGTHLVTSQMTQLTVPRMLGNSLSIVSVSIWAWCMHKAKRADMNNVQRLFQISVTGKEKLMKIMRKFLLQRSR